MLSWPTYPQKELNRRWSSCHLFFFIFSLCSRVTRGQLWTRKPAKPLELLSLKVLGVAQSQVLNAPDAANATATFYRSIFFPDCVEVVPDCCSAGLLVSSREKLAGGVAVWTDNNEWCLFQQFKPVACRYLYYSRGTFTAPSRVSLAGASVGMLASCQSISFKESMFQLTWLFLTA